MTKLNGLKKIFLRAKRTLEKNDKLIFYALVLGDLVFSFFKILPYVWINPYLLRDLSRSSQISDGYLPFVGPDTLSGGYLPGGFFYVLSYPVVALFGQNPWIFAVYTLCLKSVAFATSAWLIGAQLGVARSICLLIYLLTSLLSVFPFYFLNNSSYLIILTPCLLVALLWYFRSTASHSLWALFLTSAVLGLCLQVHFSFLFFVALFLVVIGEKEQAIGRRVLSILLATGGIFFVSAPYLIAVWHSGFSDIDSPSFFASSPSVRPFFSRYVSAVNGELVQAGKFGSADLQIFVLYIYLFVRLIVLGFERQKSHRFEKYVLCLLAFMFVFNIPYFCLQTSTRYFFISAYLVLIFVINDIAVPRRRWLGWLTVVCIGVTPFLEGALKKVNQRKGQVRAKLTIEGANLICRHFNRNGVSFRTFTENSFEIVRAGAEHSFWNSRFCFNDLSSQDSNFAKRYLLVDRLFWDPKSGIKNEVLLPREIEGALQGKSLNPELTTQDFVMLSYNSQETTNQKFGNLAFIYEVDPGLPISMQVQRWEKDPFFSNSREVIKQEARLCETPVFCSIYVLTQFEKGHLRLVLKSRALQTIWGLPPLAARLEDVKIQVLCDGSHLELGLVSRIGYFSSLPPAAPSLEFNFRTPWSTDRGIPCSKVSIKSLSAKRQILTRGGEFEVMNEMNYPLRDLSVSSGQDGLSH